MALEMKETNILLSPEEIMQLMSICEDEDKDAALLFIEQLMNSVKKTQERFRSLYQRGGHMGAARF
ncbi:MAG: hypothetical protein QME49_05790 [bacterium]|nr:hypothetical protein [bacterium]